MPVAHWDYGVQLNSLSSAAEMNPRTSEPFPVFYKAFITLTLAVSQLPEPFQNKARQQHPWNTQISLYILSVLPGPLSDTSGTGNSLFWDTQACGRGTYEEVLATLCVEDTIYCCVPSLRIICCVHCRGLPGACAPIVNPVLPWLTLSDLGEDFLSDLLSPLCISGSPGPRGGFPTAEPKAPFRRDAQRRGAAGAAGRQLRLRRGPAAAAGAADAAGAGAVAGGRAAGLLRAQLPHPGRHEAPHRLGRGAGAVPGRGEGDGKAAGAPHCVRALG